MVASVFFASDPANWDTYPHFGTDLQMYTTTMTHPDPQRLMDQFTSWEVASKENKWLGRNPTRWRNEEYDRLWKSAEAEMDPVKRAAMFIRMNDLLIQNVVVIPVIWRAKVSALSNKLKDTDISAWDSDLANAGLLASGGVERARGLGPAPAGAKPPGHHPGGPSRSQRRRPGLPVGTGAPPLHLIAGETRSDGGDSWMSAS